MASVESLAAAVAALLQAHSLPAAPGRPERLAAGLAPILETSARDQAEDPPDFAAVMEHERWRP